jgi:hypothetical protein
MTPMTDAAKEGDWSICRGKTGNVIQIANASPVKLFLRPIEKSLSNGCPINFDTEQILILKGHIKLQMNNVMEKCP